MRKGASIAYYITAHGYGHGVRSCDIIRALNRLYPDIKVQIVTVLPPGFVTNRIRSDCNVLRPRSFDIGMVQKDSIRVDVPATLDRLERLYGNSGDLIAREAVFLDENAIGLVVVDIPAIPLIAAAHAGIPRMAVGNFGWDWIYAHYTGRDQRWAPIVEQIRSAYACADLLLRLPFSEAMRAFTRMEDIPLVASPGDPRREEIAALLGCDPGKKWILISFTSLEWDAGALERVEQMRDYEFLTVHPLQWRRRNIHAIHREQVPFQDVVASVDAVLSKPGFGILSECVVNRKPLIYADRRDFAEYMILESAVRRYLKHVRIPADLLYEGVLGPSLDRIWDCPDAVETVPHDGGVAAATRIAEGIG